MSKNGNREYNEKYICCFFTIWNLKSAITYKCGRVVLSRTSVYFAISKLILLFSYSFHDHALYFLTFIFTLYVPCFFLIDHNRKQVLLIKWVIFFFEARIYFFAFFNFLKMVIFATLINVVKLYVENNDIFRRCLKLLISTLK